MSIIICIGARARNVFFCCKNGHFNMGVYGNCSFLQSSPIGQNMNCNLWHFRIGVPALPQSLPLGLDRQFFGAGSEPHSGAMTRRRCGVNRKNDAYQAQAPNRVGVKGATCRAPQSSGSTWNGCVTDPSLRLLVLIAPPLRSNPPPSPHIYMWKLL